LNRDIRYFKDQLKEYGIKADYVAGIVVFGSLGRRDEDYFSDGDFIIYLYDKAHIMNVKNAIKDILKGMGYDIQLEFTKRNKWIVFSYRTDKDYMMKLEIIFSEKKSIKNDVVYIIQSRIENFENSIIVDKDDIVDEYRKHWYSLRDKVNEEFYDILNSFIYYYDEFLSRFTRGDVYRAWMNYTISVYKLAAMMALAHGEYRNLYQPWFLTRDVIKDDLERKSLINVSAIMNPIELFNKKQKLVKIFLENSVKAAKNFNIEFDEEPYKRIISQIENKYYKFYNFRDISKIVNFCSKRVKIKSGVIFRSASLSRYDDDTILSMLKNKKIKWIIDLRTPEDIEKYERKKNRRYGEEIKKYVVSIPIETSIRIRKFDNPYMNLYYAIIIQAKDTIRKIFTEYISQVEEGGVIIHCEGGKDRTGIIIALLLDMLGVERECIIEDYLAAYSDTHRRYIELLFKILDKEFQGTREYLERVCKIDKVTLDKIKSILVVRNENIDNR